MMLEVPILCEFISDYNTKCSFVKKLNTSNGIKSISFRELSKGTNTILDFEQKKKKRILLTSNLYFIYSLSSITFTASDI